MVRCMEVVPENVAREDAVREPQVRASLRGGARRNDLVLPASSRRQTLE